MNCEATLFRHCEGVLTRGNPGLSHKRLSLATRALPISNRYRSRNLGWIATSAGITDNFLLKILPKLCT